MYSANYTSFVPRRPIGTSLFSNEASLRFDLNSAGPPYAKHKAKC